MEARNKMIKLTPLEMIAVNTSTQESFVQLMRIYESGRWVWNSGALPTEEMNRWGTYGKNYCVTAGTAFAGPNGEFTQSPKRFYLNEGYQVISPDEFYTRQGITSEMLSEINRDFESRGSN